MNHMHSDMPPRRKAEQEPLKLDDPLFDMERMEPQRVADLVAILGLAMDIKDEQPDQDYGVHEFEAVIDHEIRALPARNLQKAQELYLALATHKHPWPRAVVATYMADLLRVLPDIEYETHQGFVRLWIRLLDDEDDDVSSLAREALLDGGVDLSWFDDETARYLDRKVPDWRSEY